LDAGQAGGHQSVVASATEGKVRIDEASGK
jgi:hypothetical protein